MRTVLNDLVNARQTWGIAGTGIVAELLLARGAEGALQEAVAAVDRLAATPADDVWAAREIMLPRRRALLARAHHDELTCNEVVERYRAVATSLGLEGHIALAQAMT